MATIRLERADLELLSYSRELPTSIYNAIHSALDEGEGGSTLTVSPALKAQIEDILNPHIRDHFETFRRAIVILILAAGAFMSVHTADAARMQEPCSSFPSSTPENPVPMYLDYDMYMNWVGCDTDGTRATGGQGCASVAYRVAKSESRKGPIWTRLEEIAERVESTYVKAGRCVQWEDGSYSVW